MNCDRVVSENLLERYLDGQLDDGVRDELELHYFECEACLATLRTLQEVRPVVAQMPAPAPARKRPVAWIGLPAAAAVAMAVLFWPKEQPAPPVAQAPKESPVVAVLRLSEVQPAPYSPALFRGGTADTGAGFENGMRLYQERQWAGAAAELAKTPGPPAALHFAGISYLLAGQIEPALLSLDRVIGLGAQSPFEEEARFYRAQALLLAGRTAEARVELQRVIRMAGDYEAKARALAGKL